MNTQLIEWGGIVKEESDDRVRKEIDLLMDYAIKKEWSRKVQDIIRTRLVDPTSVIIDAVESYGRD